MSMLRKMLTGERFTKEGIAQIEAELVRKTEKPYAEIREAQRRTVMAARDKMLD